MLKNTTLVEMDLTVHCYGGEKKSKKGEEAVVAQTGANRKDFRVTAHTFPKDVVAPIQKSCAAIRQSFKGMGLNGREGTIYVTQDRYPTLKAELEKKWDAIQVQIQDTWTETKYNEMVEQQKNSMEGLFDQTKIDTRSHVLSSYGVEIFPRKIDLSQISNDPIDKAQLDGYKDRIEEGLSVLVDLLRDYTQRVIDNMNDDSSHYKCAFDTCEKVVSVARNMNIFNDSTITTVIDKIAGIFNGYSPEDFKKDANARVSVGTNAKAILAEIEKIVVDEELKSLFTSQENLV
jgi:hypothetical protein